MSTFEKAINVVLDHEGGLSDDRNDPGGVTKYGISLRYLKAELEGIHDEDGHLAGDIDGDGDVDADDVRALTLDKAIEIYRIRWWRRYDYGRVVDQMCATKVFDCSVNMGAVRAHRIAQSTANACGYVLGVDGNLGPLSVAAINDCEPREFLMEYASQMATRYRLLADRNPKLEGFLRGWLARASWPFSTGAYVA